MAARLDLAILILTIGVEDLTLVISLPEMRRSVIRQTSSLGLAFQNLDYRVLNACCVLTDDKLVSSVDMTNDKPVRTTKGSG